MSGVFESIAPPPFDPSGWDYTSTWTAFDNFSSTTFIHALNVVPTKFCIDLLCRQAEHGYYANSVIYDLRLTISINSNVGFSIVDVNSTSLRFLMAGSIRTLKRLPSNNEINLSLPKWKYRVSASL